MKSLVIIIALIGYARNSMANPPIVATLISDLDYNRLNIQNGSPVGGSISAVLPSVRSALPTIQYIAPRAFSSLGSTLVNLSPVADLSQLTDLIPLANLRSLANLASLTNLGSLANLGPLADLGSLGARLLQPTIQNSLKRSFAPLPYSFHVAARYP